MAFELISSVFRNEETIPERFSCDGKDLSPPLEWKDLPAGTESFVLIMDDPDAPVGTWTHWVLFDIPAGRRGLSEGETEGKEGLNSWGRKGYGGPCPPRGHGVHRYYFRLYALNRATLELPPGSSVEDITRAMTGSLLGKAEIMGKYERK